MVIAIALSVICGIFALLLYSLCVVSSRLSRQEEYEEAMRNLDIKEI